MWEEKLRRILSWIAVVAVVLYGSAIFLLYITAGLTDPDIRLLALRHYPVVVGLPSAAAAALFVVLILRAAAGPIEFEALTLKFKGASGPVVLWILCFLAIVLAVNTTWKSTYDGFPPAAADTARAGTLR